jgi:DNA helicase-2/ATP-dependent DNA helicase PcrA
MQSAETITEENSLFNGLNEAQREAVETVNGPLLVLAGAGTGKTRVLTTRIAHILLNKYAFPGEILAVTFTNKAAREMSERVQKLTGISQGMWLGTFHSICARMLRRNAERLGFTSSFTILDDDDQQRLIKAILQDKQIDDKNMPPKLVNAVFQHWKDQGLTPERITGANDLQQLGGRGQELYAAYQARLRQVNAMDFGDLLLHTLTLFSTHEDVLKEYAQRFKYILVDEYQDTNVAQYLWLRLLALAHRNICCVGDDDQSIYSWRGAEVGNILRFEKDFPGAKIVRLECNYRSTKHILGAASGLIANNKGRLGKTLWTEAQDGEKVRLKSVWDDQEEARYVGDEIEAAQQSRQLALNDVAILVRAGFQTRSFEERFLTMGIPYRVIGGLRFYERAEIRDAVAYLRVIASPDDDLAFERIVNVPKRGIGQATLQQLHTTARAMDISLSRATDHMLKGKLAASLSELLAGFERWRAAQKQLPLAEVAEQVLEESGYRRMWREDKTPEAPGRLENLRELLRAIGEFEGITEFLEHVGLVTDRQGAADGDMVSLMTLHAAKGLEFDTVFLPGWEEGLFPHQRAIDESGSKGLEEERRLAYVGITRARRSLNILHAANRRIYNQWQSSIPSRFIGELPKDHIENLGGGAYGSGKTALDWKREVASIISGTPPKTTAAHATGKRVFHQKFGYGRIMSAQGDHLEIAFEKAGTKKVMADFVEMV